MTNIEVTFLIDQSPNRPNGYWYAVAKSESDDVLYDAAGGTALEAVVRLAKGICELYEELIKGEA